jgi:hypothetical protein
MSNIFPGPNPWDPHAHLKEFRGEAAAVPTYLPLGPATDAAAVDAHLAQLEQTLVAKRDHAASILSGGGVDNERRRFFSEMQRAMEDDLARLQSRGGMSREQKIELHNRIGHEAQIEIKYNVDVRGFDKPWTYDELTQMDHALSRLPDRLLLEDQKLDKIYRFTGESGGHSGQYNPVSGSVAIYDAAFGLPSSFPGSSQLGVSSSFEETLIHEVGHSLDDEGPRWADYMKLSGWHRVDAALVANRPNGSQVRGADVGINEDPNGIYVVAKESGDGAFVYRQDAKFGPTNYARSNPYDDFCETLAEFTLDPEALRREAPEKYEFMRALGSNGFVVVPFPKLLPLFGLQDATSLRG